MKGFFQFFVKHSLILLATMLIITLIVSVCLVLISGKQQPLAGPVTEQAIEYELNLPREPIDKAIDAIEACQMQDGDCPK